MTMPRISFRSRLAAAAAVATLAGGLTLATAGPASAYGNGLSSDHTGDCHGADCGHRNGPATSDGGTVTWQLAGSQVVISGVVLNGLGGFPATVTVPAAFGHYTGTIGSFITLPPFIPPGIGSSQLQVAP